MGLTLSSNFSIICKNPRARALTVAEEGPSRMFTAVAFPFRTLTKSIEGKFPA